MGRKTFSFISLLVICALVWSALALWRPLAPAKATPVSLRLPAPSKIDMPWPASGQAAFGTTTNGLLASSGNQEPVPTASVAKVITALCVVKQKPIAAGSQGATITLGPNDVAIYNQYYSQDGSVAAVANGEQISEYQVLEAMMLPSANNMADSLAIWAFGSMDAYTAFANNYVKSLGMNSTHVADASGFNPQTVSTATDMFKLAQTALANPQISQIVNEGKATIPVAGTVRNVNWLLGSDGVVGIKTGNTDQAGGCFLFAAKRTIQGQDITVIGAVMNDSSLNQAILDSRNLIRAGDNNFRLVEVKAGQTIATYKPVYGPSVVAVAQKDTQLVVWQDRPVKVSQNLRALRAPQNKGEQTGTLTLSALNEAASTPVVLGGSIQKPPISWRLTHL